jgi:hypothetical protein
MFMLLVCVLQGGCTPIGVYEDADCRDATKQLYSDYGHLSASLRPTGFCVRMPRDDEEPPPRGGRTG